MASATQASGGGSPAAAGITPFRRNLPNALTVARLVLAVVFFAVLTPWRYEESRLPEGWRPDPWLLLAAGLFAVAAITDGLDGYFARRWKVVSVFGRIMDPFADKLLVIGAFVFLAGPGFWWASAPVDFMVFGGEEEGAGGAGSGVVWHLAGVQVSAVYPWMVALILGRELLVTSIRGVLEGQGIAFPATASGKWKMVLQSVTVPAVLVLIAFGGGYGAYGGPRVEDGHVPSTVAATMTYAIVGLVWATVIVTAWSGAPYILNGVRALRASRPTPTPPPPPPPEAEA